MRNKLNYDFTADFIRALAIVFVVILHTFSPYITKFNHLANLNWFIFVTIESITKVAVPLFIMLSGFLILNKEKKYKSNFDFYKKRIHKLGLPLIFWTLFYYLGFIILTSKKFEISTFIMDFIFLNTFYHLYFLFIILGLYIITPILKIFIKMISSKDLEKSIIVTFIYSITLVLTVYFLPSKISYWSIYLVFIPFLPYYMAGIHIYNLKLHIGNNILLPFYIFTVIGTIILKYYVGKSEGTTSWIFRYFSDPLSINVVLLSLLSFIMIRKNLFITRLKKTQLNKSITLTLAKYSFGVYIIHPILLFIINKLVYINHENIYTPLILFFESITIILFSILITKLASNIKFIKPLFGI